MKLLNQIKKTIKNNYKLIITFFLLLFIFTFELPYYIEAPGGVIDISKRMSIDSKLTGSLNMAYVTEYKATIPTLTIAALQKNWDVIKKEEVILDNENEDIVYFRDRLLLDEANQNAIIVGYQKANKVVNIISNKCYITYIDALSKTNLKVGDQILEVDNVKINNKNDILEVLKNKKTDDLISIKVISGKKEQIKSAKMFNYEGKDMIGLMIGEQKEIEVNPKITFNFKNSESGPSGGFMMSLAIYMSLTEDITNGLKIVGTGTIDEDGNVGEIAGIKYKILGATRAKANLFFVPNGDNYNTAIKFRDDNNLDIDIVGIDNIDAAINYLKTN